MKSIKRFLIIILSNIVGFIETLFLIRIILRALSANAGVLVVYWLYRVTDVFLVPIQGIFSNVAFRLGVIDVVAITGMILYLIVFAIIFKIILVIFGN